jgi:hypothetical protein
LSESWRFSDKTIFTTFIYALWEATPALYALGAAMPPLYALGAATPTQPVEWEFDGQTKPQEDYQFVLQVAGALDGVIAV